MLPITLAEDFEKLEFIGCGSFGRVYKGKWGTLVVAIKDVPIVAENYPLILEARELLDVHHPNLIQIYGTCTESSSFYVVMEYADCGSLQQTLHIHDPDFVYSNALALSWARQCAEGITYLHAMTPTPIIHRDIKPAKLMLLANKTKLKIINFGNVRKKSSIMTIGRGSVAYVAPEVFAAPSYNEKCDVYSWAIVLWEILAGERPFKEHESQYAIMLNVHNGQRPSTELVSITETLKDLLMRCWHHDPKLRPSMESVTKEIKTLCDDCS